ncbi:hypothetical protein [Microvirga sp. TS319]|uniref:hypothetical protein n=1 Tax=Microvirga sp. TS319 TaxID=3241165 RepID=UPI00351AAB9A
MLAEITAGLSSLKAATDIVKGLNAANTLAAINEVKLDLQERIFEAREALAAAQDAQTVALQRIRDLEQEVMQLKDWESEKQRYELKPIDRGSFAYMLKPGMESGEPPHWLCANCFSRRQKSFLQFKGQDTTPRGGRGEYSTYACDNCKGTVKVFYSRSPLKPWMPSEE